MNFTQKREYNKCPVACSLPPIYKSTFSQYLSASSLANSWSLLASIYLKKYQELPAQPGMVLSSKGNTVVLFIFVLATTALVSVHQAQTSARPKGGSPVSVGKYRSEERRVGKECSAERAAV